MTARTRDSDRNAWPPAAPTRARRPRGPSPRGSRTFRRTAQTQWLDGSIGRRPVSPARASDLLSPRRDRPTYDSGRDPARLRPFAPWSVGVEEELFVVDRRTLAPVPVPPEALDGERIKAELFAAVVELEHGACATVARPRTSSDATCGSTRSGGSPSMGSCPRRRGTWPTARAGGAGDHAGRGLPALRRVRGLIGPPSVLLRASRSRRRREPGGVHGRARARASVAPARARRLGQLALARRSAETGLASNRAEILALLPRSGAPPVFEPTPTGSASPSGSSSSSWRTRTGGSGGTSARIRRSGRSRSACRTSRRASRPRSRSPRSFRRSSRRAEPGPPADRGIYAENRWAAFRFGRAARLVHPDGTRLARSPSSSTSCSSAAGPNGSRSSGRRALLEPLPSLDGAGEQLELGRGDGLDALCRSLVDLT